AERDAGEREGVADEDVGVRARHHGRADLQSVRREDVALLAVDVIQQRDARAAIGIVLNRRDLRGNPTLVTLEVDVAIALLVAAADEARSHTSGIATPARLRL